MLILSPAPPPVPYVASAVHFDGATGITFDSNMTGVTNSKKMLASFWMANPIVLSSVWGDTPNANIDAGIPNSVPHPVLVLKGWNPAASSVYEADTDIDPTGATWRSYILSVDTSNVGAPGGCQFYTDGAQVATVEVLQDDVIDYEGKFTFASDGFGSFGTFDVAEVQVWFGIAPDLSNPTNLAAFIAAGKPVNPAVATALFGAPSIRFSGNAAAFGTNGGTAGATTVTGPLTDAGTSPSD